MDPKVLTEIFNTSSARCWSSEVNNPWPGMMPNVPSSRDYEGGFALMHQLKDVNLALSSGEGEPRLIVSPSLTMMKADSAGSYCSYEMCPL